MECILFMNISNKNYLNLKVKKKEKKEYIERNIIYEYNSYDNIFRNTSNTYFENEHYILKQIHFFIIESLFCSNSSIFYFK